MISSLHINFFLNEEKIKAGKSPLYLRISVTRKKSELFTGYWVFQKDWDAEKQRFKKNAEVNQELSDWESKIYEIAKRLEKDNRTITSHTIKNILTKKEQLDIFLLEYFQSHIDRLDKANEVNKETVTRYEETKTYISNYLKTIELTDILIDKVNYKFITDFDLFMITQKSNPKNEASETLKRNTVNKHHSRFRTILIRAVKEGLITKNPFSDFKLKYTPATRAFLTEEEIERITNNSLGDNESLKRVRDVFVFSIYTGLRFEDAQQLTMNRICKDKNGKYSIQIESQEKTGEPVLLPLLKPAISIIDKYEGSPERLLFNKVLPKISNQKTNAYLKVIGEMVGIEKKLHHHVARHSCATTILLSNEVPIEAVSKWLGHTNIKTTQIYAKISNQYLQKIADKLEA